MTKESVIKETDYWDAAKQLLYCISERPLMYVRNPQEFDSLLFGHQYAYIDIGAINDESGFVLCFRYWLRKEKGMPSGICSGDWIEETAKESAKDGVSLLVDFIREFIQCSPWEQ